MQSVVFAYEEILMISSCLMDPYPPYLSRPSKIILYHKNFNWRNAFDFITKNCSKLFIDSITTE